MSKKTDKFLISEIKRLRKKNESLESELRFMQNYKDSMEVVWNDRLEEMKFIASMLERSCVKATLTDRDYINSISFNVYEWEEGFDRVDDFYSTYARRGKTWEELRTEADRKSEVHE